MKLSLLKSLKKLCPEDIRLEYEKPSKFIGTQNNHNNWMQSDHIKISLGNDNN